MDEQPDRGGPSDRVKIDGVWEDGLGKALDKEKPAEGWLDEPGKSEDEKGQQDD